jgi:Ca2+-binding EF-hand superfamily protein
LIPIEIINNPIYVEQLDVARRLFAKYDTNNSGYLERSEVAKLLEDTYQTMSKYSGSP